MQALVKISFHTSIVILLILAPLCFSQQATERDFNRVRNNYIECRDALKQKCAYENAVKAFQLGARALPRPNEELASLAHDLGSLTLHIRRYDLAYERLLQALTLSDEVYGEISDQSFQVLLDILDAENKSSNSIITNEDRHWRRAAELARTLNASNSLAYADQLLVIGSFLALSQVENRINNGRILHTQAYDIYSSESGIDDIRTGVSALHIGKAHAKTEELENSVDWFNRALESFDEAGKAKSQIALSTHGNLVAAYEKMGKSRKANKHCRAIGKASPTASNSVYRPLYQFTPDYPEEVLESGESGFVVYKFNVSKQGKVMHPKLYDSSLSKKGEKAALKAVKQFRYAPKFLNGKPVETFGVTYRFDLQELL